MGYIEDMKRLLLIPLALFVLSCDKKQKETVVEKYDDGTTETVNIVTGKDLKQEIIGRIK